MHLQLLSCLLTSQIAFWTGSNRPLDRYRRLFGGDIVIGTVRRDWRAIWRAGQYVLRRENSSPINQSCLGKLEVDLREIRVLVRHSSIEAIAQDEKSRIRERAATGEGSSRRVTSECQAPNTLLARTVFPFYGNLFTRRETHAIV